MTTIIVESNNNIWNDKGMAQCKVVWNDTGMFK